MTAAALKMNSDPIAEARQRLIAEKDKATKDARRELLANAANAGRLLGLEHDKIAASLADLNADALLSADEVDAIAANAAAADPAELQAAAEQYYRTEQNDRSTGNASGQLIGGPTDDEIAELRIYDGVDDDDPGPMPEHLLQVGGLIGAITDYTIDTGYTRQPALALAGAIALVATITGRKITDEYGTRTNIYVASVAASTTGKERSRKVNDALLTAAGLGGTRTGLIGPESLASHAGILSALHERPVMLTQINEMGRYLGAVTAKGAASHITQTVDMLLKLYSCADDRYRGHALKDLRETKPIEQPHLVVYGSTVPDNFFNSLNKDSVTGGLIGRFLFFRGEDDPVEQDPLPTPLPTRVVDRIRTWGSFLADHYYRPIRVEGDDNNDSNKIDPSLINPRVVPTTDDAKAVFTAFREKVAAIRRGKDEMTRALWGRALEKARKLALIRTASDRSPVTPGPNGLSIDKTAATWACEIVEWQTRWLHYHIRDRFAETPFEQDGQELQRFVREQGGRVPKRAIQRKFRRWTSRYIGELLEARAEAGLLKIEAEKPVGGGHSKVFVTIP